MHSSAQWLFDGLLIHFPTDGHLGCFHFLALPNNVARSSVHASPGRKSYTFLDCSLQASHQIIPPCSPQWLNQFPLPPPFMHLHIKPSVLSGLVLCWWHVWSGISLLERVWVTQESWSHASLPNSGFGDVMTSFSMKWARTGVFTPWKVAHTTNQDCPGSPREQELDRQTRHCVLQP